MALTSGEEIKKKPQKSRLIKQLDKLCSTYIKLRDRNICQWCGKYVEGVNAHCSHVIPKSHGNALRFDEMNMKILCWHCHINIFHKNPLEAAEWFKGKFPERWEYLQTKKNEIVKFSIEDYQNMIAEYQDKICGLEISK